MSATNKKAANAFRVAMVLVAIPCAVVTYKRSELWWATAFICFAAFYAVVIWLDWNRRPENR
jgi:hypothetical protein